jgi:hypothetical protein
MNDRRVYDVSISVNNKIITKVIIDPHYAIKHSDSIDDTIILKLVSLLDGGIFTPEMERDGFTYYKTEPLIIDDKNYRLIWLLDEYGIYIGVINAFRR